MTSKIKILFFIFVIIITIFYFNESVLNTKYFFDNKVDYSKIENSIENQNTKEKQTNELYKDGLYFEYKVSKVIDGDTLKLKKINGNNFDNGENEITVRLIGVNTPESVAPNRPVECFGKEASNYVKNLVNGNFVAIEKDSTQSTYDKYNRLLAYVYIKIDENIFMLNKKIIEDGYAYEYTYSVPYKYQKEFKEVQKYAKENELGLWHKDTCNGLKTPVLNK